MQPTRRGSSEGVDVEQRDNCEGSVGRQRDWLLVPMFMLKDYLGKGLATATPVGAAFPVEGIVYLL